MTLILKLDLDMVKMYLHTKNEVSISRGSKFIAWTDRNKDRQTDRHDRKHYLHYLPAYADGKYCFAWHRIADQVKSEWFSCKSHLRKKNSTGRKKNHYIIVPTIWILIGPLHKANIYHIDNFGGFSACHSYHPASNITHVRYLMKRLLTKRVFKSGLCLHFVCTHFLCSKPKNTSLQNKTLLMC